ncbi:MAG: ribosome recycling factor, partial [Dehalococcoidales bacterium]|nr:ribosome recycling factor [Dehalococcoidales bacterium]
MTSPTLVNIEQKMQRAAEGLKMELAALRTGHATPSLIEHIKVEYTGVMTPLNQMAGVTAPEARLLVIQPWDKSSIHSIEKTILTSDLGLNPVSDGNVIRINIPPLSEERRQELAKVVRRRVEERRISIRSLRREAMDELKEAEKNNDISQDEYKRSLNQLQKLTDSFIANAEK